jgi:serpin B
LDDKAKKVLDNASAKFFADLFSADLQSEDTIAAMNSWVSAKTEGLIKEIPFKPGDGTKMLLFNALYFKKKWDDPIDKALTAKEDFTLASGEKIKVDMMKAEVAYYKEANMKYYRTGNTLSAPYYYSDGSYCIFVRPEKVCGRDDMKNIISNEVPDIIDAFINWRTKGTGSLKLSIPKLSYETKTEHMQDELMELGVNSVFDSAAEPFSPLGGGLAITEIAQKCKIIMDEDGTEAAAVTEIAMDESAPCYEEPNIELNLDRPYAYVIMSGNNIPLFIGAVENPAAE